LIGAEQEAEMMRVCLANTSLLKRLKIWSLNFHLAVKSMRIGTMNKHAMSKNWQNPHYLAI
jgi:hypothetical protein